MPGRPLTEREQQVARLVAEGKTDREIGELLTITRKTVSTHIFNAMNKLGVYSRGNLAERYKEGEHAQ